jgi:hypothetical protein
MKPPALRPVVIIGAARSGTKILRDSLSVALGVPCLPYDVGFVWGYGTESREDDCLSATDLTPGSERLIRRFLGRYADTEGRLIEKSVSNTLRVPFVAAVLPGATFVHLIRDGVDVAESTRRQWTAPPDYRYLAGKARHFPLRLAPTYGRRYAASLVRRRLAADGRVATWGPRYPGMITELAQTDLLTVCARQWRESVNRARQGLAETGVRAVEVRYETLVKDPAAALDRIADVCELSTTPTSLAAAAAGIRPDRTGHGRTTLTDTELQQLDDEIGADLAALEYQRPRQDPQPRGEIPT